jgi:hypothetical protein
LNTRISVGTAVLAVASLSFLVAQGLPPTPTNLRFVTKVERPPKAPRVDPDLDPAPNGRHPYYEALIKRADRHKNFSLRSQEQLDYYAQKRGGSTSVTYSYPNDPDPRRQDAAKVTIPAGTNSIVNQVRLPIDVTEGSVVVTWDAWFGSEFEFKTTNINNYKTFQFASPIEGIWCEVRTRFNLVDAPNLAAIDSRGYIGGSRTYEDSFGPNVTDDLPLSPQLAEFYIRPEKWTRFWAVFERTPTWDLYSLWVADEDREPVQLHNRLQLKFRDDRLGMFWIEYNTSSTSTRNVGALTSYVRNVVMLRNVPDMKPLLLKPTR